MSQIVDFGLFQTMLPSFVRTLERAQAVAVTAAPVLITGESGTGKNLLTQLIVGKSRWSSEIVRLSPWSEIPQEIPSGIFFVVEDLDQWSLEHQSQLSQLMDEVKIQKKSVRFIAQSTKSLKGLMEEGAFRSDLFYRLSVVHYALPSLKDRKEDILPLSEIFLKVLALIQNQKEKVLSAAAKRKLVSYSWPGNVSELENVIERANHLSRDPVIEEDHIEFLTSTVHAESQAGMTLSEMERKLILQTLQMTQQNKTRAAQILGISIRTLRNKLNEYRDVGVMEVGVG